ncbi:MAG: NAD(+) synthase, partial [Bacillota bacterium]|nr:NAD(+) synthase [Bacillota bacterium]
LSHLGTPRLVIGVSGGLDSTLALLVAAEAFHLLKRDPQDVIAVTMPGFGTSHRTYRNALMIMRLLGVTLREISIKDAVLQHLEDIGHDPSLQDLTYENAQARERTQILMDLANKEGGFVLGTGDLSESALGWCTYNGDHMAMYNANCSVPKTLIPHIIRQVMDRLPEGSPEGEEAAPGFPDPHRSEGASPAPAVNGCFYCKNTAALKAALLSVIDTPISPELLPAAEDGEIAQKSEDTVGPYALHDFFLYHTVLGGATPARLCAMACRAFAGEYDRAVIRKWLLVFYRRFFRQQYKRNCMPEGPQAGPVSLSPRGGWAMPGDAEMALWLKEMQEL